MPLFIVLVRYFLLKNTFLMVLYNTWPLLNRHKVMFQLFSSVSLFVLLSKRDQVYGESGGQTTMVEKGIH